MRNLMFSLAAAMLVSSAANATLIAGAGSLAGANPITLPAANYTGAGPQTLGPITFTSDVATSQFGWTGGADFGPNGAWAAGDPILALNDAGFSNMTLTFANPVSGFLADLNWKLVGGGFSVLMIAYDVNGDLLTHDEFPANNSLHFYWQLANNGSSNVFSPGYFGFTFDSPVIKSVAFSSGFIGARNLSWTGPAVGGVPEPASWAMLIAGFGLVGAMQRRRTLSVA